MLVAQAFGEVRERVIEGEQIRCVTEAEAEHAGFVRFVGPARRRGQFLDVAAKVEPCARKPCTDTEVFTESVFGTEVHVRFGVSRKIGFGVQRQTGNAARLEESTEGERLGQRVGVVGIFFDITADHGTEVSGDKRKTVILGIGHPGQAPVECGCHGRLVFAVAGQLVGGELDGGAEADMLHRESDRRRCELAARFVFAAVFFTEFVVANDSAVRNPVIRGLQDELLVLRRVRNRSLVVGKFARLPVDFRNALFAIGDEDCRRVQLRDGRVGGGECRCRFLKSRIARTVESR